MRGAAEGRIRQGDASVVNRFRRAGAYALSGWVFTVVLIGSAVGTPGGAQSTRAGAARRPSEAVVSARAALSQSHPEQAIPILTSYLQTHPGDLNARLTLGEAYLVSGQSDLAESEFKSVLKMSPENASALFALASLYQQAGHLEQAEPLLERAVKSSNGLSQLRLQWAAVLSRLHRYEEAERALAGVLPPQPTDQRIAYYRLKGSVDLGNGKAAAAAADMEAALRLKPDDSGLQMATGISAVQAGNSSRAISLLEPLFEKSSDPRVGLLLLEAQLAEHHDAGGTLSRLRNTSFPSRQQQTAMLERIGEILISQGRFEDSIQDFEKAAELGPPRADLLFNLGLAQFRSGRLDQAIVSVEKARNLADSAELEDLRGDIQEAKGDNLAAVESYQAAVRLAPDEERYRMSLGLELLRHKSFEAAKAVFEQAAEYFPGSWRLKLALGLAHFFMGSDEEATAALMRAADLAPNPVAALEYLGEIQMEQAAAPDPAALSRLCEYADKHPGAGKIESYCGSLMLKRDTTSGEMGRAEEIIRRLQNAARLVPESASIHCQMGRAHEWRGRWKEARSETETCARMDPNLAEAHYRLARIYQHFGETELARKETELHTAAAKRRAEENERRDTTIKTFLYTLKNQPAGRD